jgi:arabinan endo-1,5-alpha-L-arabinosidase
MIKLKPAAAITAAALTLLLGAGTVAGSAAAAPSAPPSPAVTTAAAAKAPQTRSLNPTGDITPIHDPALTVDRGVWYVFSTGYVHREQGGTIRIATSHDHGRTWKASGSVWDTIPAWIDQHYADQGKTLPDNLWAPEIVKHGKLFYLYYSASTFGGNDSITALATNTTLDPSNPHYKWVDRGPVITSTPGQTLAGGLEFNAIDAGIITDRHGKPYLSIGSFWNGIFLVPLSWPSGKPVHNWQAKTVHLAERPGVQYDPIEGAYLVRHGRYYYLFTSRDFCCRGADSTYKIAVGRSTSVKGPYRDEQGRDLVDGGGTILLQTRGDHIGAGGQSVYKNILAYHYYDAGNTAAPYIPTLGLEKIHWKRGWPTLGR